MSDSSGELFFLAGVTASGKTELAITWAQENNAEILSCDSVAFYKGMDIGSSKPSLDDQNKVCHYGLDLSPVNECFDISRFVEYARDVVSQVHASGKKLLVVGGSGFYLHSFFEPVIDDVSVKPEIRMEVEALRLQGIDQMMDRLRLLNPDGLGNLDLFNPMRVAKALERCMSSGKSLLELNHEFASLPKPYGEVRKSVLWLDREKDIMEDRIMRRTLQMIEMGFLEEVNSLIQGGIEENPTARKAVGYREVIAHLKGEIDKDEMIKQINLSTARLAAKQRKWFRNHLPEGSRLLLSDEKPVSSVRMNWISDS